MGYYIGIDLGTTNSVICSYDTKNTQVYKSPEQSDVTPSAIYVDKRGRRYYGRRAYEMAPLNEKNAATLFKRYLGTGKTFAFEATGEVMTPEMCSAEVLRVLFGYLPEEIRSDPDVAAVITVPAAFNQMKKDATLEAARLAGIGRVALMQEPVAAVMSVMKQDNAEKTFLIYDLGGGTFDITVARSVSGRVSLLAQGGREMCGGRDWDRMIFRKIVEPWLRSHFRLALEASDPTVRKVTRLAMLAIEQAKIELSACEETAVRMDEVRMGAQDLDDEEIYLDVPLTRDMLNDLIEGMIEDTVEVTKELMEKSGLSPSDVDQIVFIGGPTCYKPLRDAVTQRLGVCAGVEMNPMTAVAEGAAIYAESIDWSNERHEHKAAKGEARACPGIQINYEKRTTADQGRVAFLTEETGMTVEITCEDTGWVSGRTNLKDKLIIRVPLMNMGENAFRLTVYGKDGMPVRLDDGRIVISRTLSAVSAIPASHPIAVKALDRIGGHPVPIYLVEENDLLPKRGSITFLAGRALAAGSADALVFTLWEGAIREPIEDNRYIGTYRIPGSSFYSGVIPAGAQIICDYEMNESGALHLGVSIPCVGVNLTGRNFYSRAEGQLDIQDAPKLIREADQILMRTQQMKMRIHDPQIDSIRRNAMDAKRMISGQQDAETMQEAANALLDCRRVIAKLRQAHSRQLRRMDLEQMISHFEMWKPKATQAEIAAFLNVREEAEYAIEHELHSFDACIDEIRKIIASIAWRQDDHIILRFNSAIRNPGAYTDRAAFDRLRAEGIAHMEKGRIDDLRSVLSQMYGLLEQDGEDSENMYDEVNIVRS
ncbi:MAG: Hsp70 family protein [Clostridia bacterium]|nr:Hsp70 family protein [Clostridia bacterium]